MKFLPGPKSGGPLSICRPQLSEQASGEAVLSRGRYGQALQGHASWKARYAKGANSECIFSGRWSM